MALQCQLSLILHVGEVELLFHFDVPPWRTKSTSFVLDTILTDDIARKFRFTGDLPTHNERRTSAYWRRYVKWLGKSLGVATEPDPSQDIPTAKWRVLLQAASPKGKVT
jgi:hypothetical protein